MSYKIDQKYNGRELLGMDSVSEAKKINTTERTMEIIASTSVKDRMGDVVMPLGISTKNFRKNGPIMWAHDYSKLPLGKALSWWVEKDKFKMKIKFDDTTEFQRDAFRMVSKGFIKGWSIGFIPEEFEEIKKDGESGGLFGPKKFTKIELLECSLCPIPANPSCVSAIKGMGIPIDDRYLLNVDDGSYLEIVDDEDLIEVNEKELQAMVDDALQDAIKPYLNGRLLDLK